MSNEGKGKLSNRASAAFLSRGNRLGLLNLDEPPSENEPSGQSSDENWVHRHRGAHLESVTLSLWSWLLVLALTAWFCIWLLDALSRLGTRMP
jgi:hypothetical protein